MALAGTCLQGGHTACPQVFLHKDLARDQKGLWTKNGGHGVAAQCCRWWFCGPPAGRASGPPANGVKMTLLQWPRRAVGTTGEMLVDVSVSVRNCWVSFCWKGLTGSFGLKQEGQEDTRVPHTHLKNLVRR